MIDPCHWSDPGLIQPVVTQRNDVQILRPVENGLWDLLDQVVLQVQLLEADSPQTDVLGALRVREESPQHNHRSTSIMVVRRTTRDGWELSPAVRVRGSDWFIPAVMGGDPGGQFGSSSCPVWSMTVGWGGQTLEDLRYFHSAGFLPAPGSPGYSDLKDRKQFYSFIFKHTPPAPPPGCAEVWWWAPPSTSEAVLIDSSQFVLTDLKFQQSGGKVGGHNIQKVSIQVETPQGL